VIKLNPSRLTLITVAVVLALTLFSFAIDASAETIDPPVIDQSSLVLWLKFNEGNGTTAYDSSGNGNNGTIYGATWTTGRYGYGLSFDGDDYIEVANSESLNFSTTNAITISVWFKEDQIIDWSQFVVKSGVFSLRHGGGDDIYAQIGDGVNPQGVGYVSGYCIGDKVGKWIHAVFVYDYSAQRAELWVNGAKVKTSLNWVGTFEQIGSNTNPVKIGASAFNGIIDEVHIYNRALNETEIKSMYEALRIHIKDETNLQSIANANVTIFNSNTSISVPIDNVTKDAILFHQNMSGYGYGQYFISVSANNYYERKLIANINDGQLTELTSYLPPTSANIVQDIFTLNDLTGKYEAENVILQIKKPIADEVVPIFKSYFDFNSQTAAYLILDDYYQLSLITPDQEINYGWLVPDPDGQIPVTIGEISLSPVYTALQKNITYEFRKEGNNLVLQYNDSTSQTSRIDFYVYNSSGSLVYQDFAEQPNAVFYFNITDQNETYLVAFNATLPNETISAKRYMNINEETPIDIEDPYRTMLFGGLLVILSAGFGYADARKGAIIISLLAALFVVFGFLTIPWSTVMLAISFAVLVYLAEASKKWKGGGE